MVQEPRIYKRDSIKSLLPTPVSNHPVLTTQSQINKHLISYVSFRAFLSLDKKSKNIFLFFPLFFYTEVAIYTYSASPKQIPNLKMSSESNK